MTTALLNRLHGAAQAAAPNRSSRVRAIARIRRETGCSSEAAHETMEFVERLVKQTRVNPDFVAYPTAKQLRSRAYRIFEQVIPHDQVATPGSAHADIEAAVLDPTRNEFGLRHEMRDEHGRDFCTIRTCLSVVN